MLALLGERASLPLSTMGSIKCAAGNKNESKEGELRKYGRGLHTWQEISSGSSNIKVRREPF